MAEATPGYREYLAQAASEAQANYDKTLIALAGGALGVSFAFVEKFIAPDKPVVAGYLFWAWMSWVASLILSLWSFFVARATFVWAIRQYDRGKLDLANPGGWRAVLTWWLNFLAGVTFVAGLILAAYFAAKNLEA